MVDRVDLRTPSAGQSGFTGIILSGIWCVADAAHSERFHVPLSSGHGLPAFYVASFQAYAGGTGLMVLGLVGIMLYLLPRR